jgi:uncharacterized protein YfaA (DUF2138 family)
MYPIPRSINTTNTENSTCTTYVMLYEAPRQKALQSPPIWTSSPQTCSVCVNLSRGNSRISVEQPSTIGQESAVGDIVT